MRKDYLSKGGKDCPVCHSDNISFQSPQVSDFGATFKLHTCLNETCGVRWKEYYLLDDIELIEKEK